MRADSLSRSTGNTTSAVVSGARVVVLAQIFTLSTRFVMSVVLAILLLPRDIGVVAIAQTVMLFFDQIRDMGTGIALIQKAQLRNPMICTVFLFNVLLGAGLMLAQVALSEPVGAVMHEPQAGTILLALAPIPFVLSLGQVHHALLRRDLKYRQIAILNALAALANALASLLGALAGMGPWALALGIAVGYCVDTMLSWYFDDWRPWAAWKVEWRSMRDIAGFSTRIFAANAVGFLFSQSDKLLVGRWLGAGPLGLYSLAQRVLSYPRAAVSNMVGEVTLPAFAKHQADNVALQKGFVRAARVVALLTFPVMAGAAAVARPTVDGGLGPAWHGLTPLIWILAPLGAVQSITTLAGGLIVAKGRGGGYLSWTLLSSVPGLALFAIGLQWSLNWACIAGAGVYLLLTPLLLFLCFREVHLSVRTFARHMLAVTAISTVMAGVVVAVDATLGTSLPHLATMVVGIGVGVIVYVALLAIVRPAALTDTAEALFSRKRV